MNLTLFEKFLKGYKTYIVAAGAIVYGVLENGFKQHHWTTLGGAWDWVFSASTVATVRAALATYFKTLLSGLGFTNPVVTPPAPVMNGVNQLASAVTDESGEQVTDPNAAR